MRSATASMALTSHLQEQFKQHSGATNKPGEAPTMSLKELLKFCELAQLIDQSFTAREVSATTSPPPPPPPPPPPNFGSWCSSYKQPH
jgi:hypothetical protein